MNQILSVEPPNNKKNQKANTNSVTKIFAIGLLILGIIIIAIIGYMMYEKAEQAKKVDKPTIIVDDQSGSGKEINIKVTSSNSLSKVTYQWNEEEPVDMKADGKKKIEELVTIPNGTNNLTIIAVDTNGKETTHTKKYTIEGNIKIEIKPEGESIKIQIEGKEQLQYLTYRWDEQEEQRIEIRDFKKEQLVEIPEGLHTLTVVVVDQNNNTERKEQEVRGVKPPKIKITTDGIDNFIVKCTDATGIAKIEITLNEGETETKDIKAEIPLEERKEYEFKYPIAPGVNKLKIKAINESGVSAIKGAMVTK